MKKIQEMTNEELQNALDIMSTMEEAKTTVEKIKAEMKARKEKEALKEQEVEATLVANQKDILGRYFKDDNGNVHFYYKVIGVIDDLAIVETFTANNRYYRKYASKGTIDIKLVKSYKEIAKSEYDEMKDKMVRNLNYVTSVWDLFPTMF